MDSTQKNSSTNNMDLDLIKNLGNEYTDFLYNYFLQHFEEDVNKKLGEEIIQNFANNFLPKYSGYEANFTVNNPKYTNFNLHENYVGVYFSLQCHHKQVKGKDNLNAEFYLSCACGEDYNFSDVNKDAWKTYLNYGKLTDLQLIEIYNIILNKLCEDFKQIQSMTKNVEVLSLYQKWFDEDMKSRLHRYFPNCKFKLFITNGNVVRVLFSRKNNEWYNGKDIYCEIAYDAYDMYTIKSLINNGYPLYQCKDCVSKFRSKMKPLEIV